MKYHRCLKLCVPKTRGISTADAFRWSETNTLRLPTVTLEEQITNSSLSLSQAMRNNSTFCLPNTDLRANTHKLASIFQQGADKIEQDKLTSKINKDLYLRVEKTDKTVLPLPIANNMLPTHPRVKIRSKPMALPPTNSPCTYATCKDGSLLNKTHAHRYFTRPKGQLVNSTTQLEQNQMKECLPVTFNFSDTKLANPPNQLKHNKLTQRKDKEKWLQGMSNALDSLTQGFDDVKGNNKFFFISKNKIPKGK